jgi:hypothetical protein
VFPAEQLHVLLYDDVCRDPRGVLVALARHLDVDPRFFEGRPEAELRRRALEGPPLALRPSLRPLLRELYAPRIAALEVLLGRDLGAWRSSLG